MADMTGTLVLWDIDLTLVEYRGIGREWYRAVMANAHGLTIEHVPVFAGRTERAIATEMLARHGVAQTEEQVQRLFDELVAVVARAHPELAGRGRALPGAAPALRALSGREHVVQSLVTGNLAEVAAYKLTPFGLHEHLDLDVGGYGSISPHRHDLVADAMRLAEAKYGRRFAPSSVVVIGDTPDDVAGALHHGAVAIGVATGRSSAEELTDSGAHVVLADLSDTDAVLDAILR